MSMGPRTEPWGTPEQTSNLSDSSNIRSSLIEPVIYPFNTFSIELIFLSLLYQQVVLSPI